MPIAHSQCGTHRLIREKAGSWRELQSESKLKMQRRRADKQPGEAGHRVHPKWQLAEWQANRFVFSLFVVLKLKAHKRFKASTPGCLSIAAVPGRRVSSCFRLNASISTYFNSFCSFFQPALLSLLAAANGFIEILAPTHGQHPWG